MAATSDEQAVDSSVFRGAWRREKIAARQALSAEEHALASARIEIELASLLSPLSPRTIAFCWPVRREFDCRPVVERLIVSGWRACQPVVVARDAPMQFRAWQPNAEMTTDPYGIPVPAAAVGARPDVILLPLVAFDEQGFRLGYGGGYFDRTLAELAAKPLAIGVGFELCRIDSVGPGPHDIRMDAIVTEAGIRRYADVA